MRRLALILASGLVLSLSVNLSPGGALEPSVGPPECVRSPFTAEWAGELQRRWPGNQFSAAVIDLRDGCEYSYRPELRMTTASVFKAEVLAGVLLRAQGEDRDLTSREHSLVWPMITESANPPTSALYRELGGAPGFDSLNRRFGLFETQAAPSVWGLTRTSARDQAHLARQLLVGDVGPFSRRSVDIAWRYMGSVVPSQRWGVGDGLAPGFSFGLKNGFAPSRCCGWRINTAGVVLDPRGGGWAMAILTDGWGSEAAGRNAMSFASSRVNQAMTQLPPVDLVALNVRGEQGVELHALAGTRSYQSFRAQAATALGVVEPGEWSFALGDYDHDPRSDLFAVKRVGESGSTEIHVLSGASDWREWALHASTGLGVRYLADWQFFVSDYDGDAIDDLFAISMDGATGTEVHVLDGAATFARFSAHHATGLHRTSPDGWAFDLADVDRDGREDLVALSLRGRAGVEVHALSAASGFREFAVHAPTALPAVDAADWAFAKSDRRGQGLPDLVAVSRRGRTGTEVHVLDGARGWSEFNLHAATALPATGGPEWRFLT